VVEEGGGDTEVKQETVGGRWGGCRLMPGAMMVRPKAEKFEDLDVWQKAHELVLETYKITKRFPSDEKFGLVSQMRRAAVSTAANIAEGFKKRGVKDKSNYYNIAQGSAKELRYYLTLAKDLGYISTNEHFMREIEAVGKMLSSLMSAVLAR
jgi:four helix bundle protein